MAGDLHLPPGVDLSGGSLMDEAIREAEIEAGFRCTGCGRRITVGFEFWRYKQAVVQGQLVMNRQRTFACTNDDCDHGLKARSNSVGMKMVEYAWLEGEEAIVESAPPAGLAPDPPPALMEPGGADPE